jgi:asparagine N-glycosylation enzyme membrane subunit Stt3
MVEYVTGAGLIGSLQNPAYPAGLQFLQWVLLIAFGAVFLIGYATRWSLTPLMMIVVSAMLASMCFIQTVDFLTSDFRFVAFALECLAYILIAVFLLKSQRMRGRFGRGRIDRRAGAPFAG